MWLNILQCSEWPPHNRELSSPKSTALRLKPTVELHGPARNLAVGLFLDGGHRICLRIRESSCRDTSVLCGHIVQTHLGFPGVLIKLKIRRANKRIIPSHSTAESLTFRFLQCPYRSAASFPALKLQVPCSSTQS